MKHKTCRTCGADFKTTVESNVLCTPCLRTAIGLVAEPVADNSSVEFIDTTDTKEYDELGEALRSWIEDRQ